MKKYLVAKFDLGERTGHKADPAKDERGERLFTREEWLKKQQIKGFFSRLAKKRRKEQPRQIQTSAEENTDDTDSDFEENVEREMLVHNIIAEINVFHPIHYDVYDLCDMYEQEAICFESSDAERNLCTF